MNDRDKLVLLQYAAAHGLVDLSCAAALFSLWYVWSPGMGTITLAILVYGVLAFGTQPLFGWLSDRLALPRLMAVAGCTLTALGVLVLPVSFWLVVILLGVGNALFHVGGGSISLNLTPYRATAPGLFVAPGAIGLALGTLIGKSDFAYGWIFAVALMVMAVILYRLKPSLPPTRTTAPARSMQWVGAFVLIFLVIAGRSLLGFSWVMPWKSDVLLLLVMTIAVVLGKGLGGILADRYGFIAVALGGVVVSAPLLIIFPAVPALAIIGVFLFQFTMPVTLAAMYRLFPKRPGLAFGLPCLALIIGALPVLLQQQRYFSGTDFLAISFALVAVAVFLGLRSVVNRAKTVCP